MTTLTSTLNFTQTNSYLKAKAAEIASYGNPEYLTEFGRKMYENDKAAYISMLRHRTALEMGFYTAEEMSLINP